MYEGPTDQTTPDFKTLVHFFEFANFQHKVMRLDPSDYFEYGPPNEVTEAERRFRRESEAQHRYYLSYGGLLRSLVLHDMVDEPKRLRIEAHHTFLGRFLHATREAAQDLIVKPNVHKRLVGDRI